MAASFIASLLHPSVRFSCKHLTTSKCPFLAAQSIAYLLHPSVRFSCNHITTSKCPCSAAQFIASLSHPSVRFSCNHITTSKCPFAAASFITFLSNFPPHLLSRITFPKYPLFAPSFNLIFIIFFSSSLKSTFHSSSSTTFNIIQYNTRGGLRSLRSLRSLRLPHDPPLLVRFILNHTPMLVKPFCK